AYNDAQPAPGTSTFTQDILTAAAQRGDFTYLEFQNGSPTGAKRTVNVLDVARPSGNPSTIDPTMAGILGKINASQAGASGFVPIAGVPSEFMVNMQWSQALNTMQSY